MWPFSQVGPSGFSWYSTAEEVTEGIDGTGLTAIVTGASNGIGRVTAHVLAKRGVHVIIGDKDVATAVEVKKTILKEIRTAKLDVLELDLSSFVSVRKFASEFNSLNLPLNILINNAGIMGTPFLLSRDGIELQFAVNHLGHFLLTSLLLENMKMTSQKTNIEGRIVNVASYGHQFTYNEGICFEKINDASMYHAFFAYGQSKLANILHANELSRRLAEEGVQITANSLHPGAMMTKIAAHRDFVNFCGKVFRPILSLIVGKLLIKTLQQGAATTCYVALHPQVRGVGGKYFVDSNIATPSSKALDPQLAKKLWDFSLKLLG